jgi:SAM-dependent MidA family methyltransferase
MELALHHPEHGYYARGPERLGRGGDFFTASDVGAAFGGSLARCLAEMDGALGHPDRFSYVELGAGRGWLARDVIDALAGAAPDLARRLHPMLVDTSAGMREAARTAVSEAAVLHRVPGVAQRGCVVAVEWLDALPVHRVARRGARLVELGVDWRDDRPVEIDLEPSAEVAAWVGRYGAAPEDGDEAEIPLELAPALASIDTALERGFVIVVDYGHEASRLFGPAHRRGTLLAYHRHRASEEYLERVGEQDLTAHVNLTALVDEAKGLGWQPLTVTSQDRFLIANGILDGLDDPSDTSLAAVKRRLQAKQLIHPHGMGRAFKVAVFSKGVDPPPDLPGLRDPFGGRA